MRSIAGLVFVMSLALGGRGLRAQEAAPSGPPVPPPPPATAAEVLGALREVSSDAPAVLRLEAKIGPGTVGYISATLTPPKPDGPPTLEYHSESVMMSTDRTRTETQIHARLTPKFEPIELELRRETRPAKGDAYQAMQRIEFTDSEMILHNGPSADKLVKTVQPRPPSPFVGAIEFLVQRIDPKRFPKFIVNELSALRASVVRHEFSTGPEPHGGFRLASQTAGRPGYSFQVDAKGEVESWREPLERVVFQRCSPDRFTEVKDLFKK